MTMLLLIYRQAHDQNLLEFNPLVGKPRSEAPKVFWVGGLPPPSPIPWLGRDRIP